MSLNKLIALGAIIFSSLIIYGALHFENNLMENDFTGPRFFPLISATLLIILSILLLYHSRFDESLKKLSFKKQLIPSLVIIVLIGYIMVLPTLGFPLSTFLLVILTLLLFNVKKYLTIIIFSLIISGLIYYLFTQLLTVDLPFGELPERLYEQLFSGE